MRVRIKRLKPTASLPVYQTTGSAAVDLSACLDETVELQPLERAVIPTGIAVSLPVGTHAEVRARSGLAAKHGIGLVNGIGTIDADYRGEIGVILVNLSNEPFVIESGMRIAQMVLTRHETFVWQEVDELDETGRGEGGYGSTKH